MRVAMLTLYPIDTRLAPGGVRMVSVNLVEGLRRYGDLDLHVIHCHGDVAEDQTVHDGNLTLHFLGMPRRRIIPNLVSGIGPMVRLLRAIQPDIVHAHLPDYVYAAVRSGRPTVYTIYGVVARERRIYTSTLFDRLRYALLSAFEAYALPRVRQLVASSPYVLREYGAVASCIHPGAPPSLAALPVRAHGITPAGRRTAPWVCIQNPMPQTFFELQDRSEGDRILYVGSIDERKDILTLLRAMRTLYAVNPAVRLILIGKVNSASYAQQVHAFVRENHLDERVQFLGYVERQRVIEEYERCAVLALTSREETAPMVILEAMAAGKPVVATRAGGVPDLVRDGENGFLVPPGDDRALAQRLQELLGDADLRRRMGLTAKAWCREHFHVDQVARQYYELYRRLLAAER